MDFVIRFRETVASVLPADPFCIPPVLLGEATRVSRNGGQPLAESRCGAQFCSKPQEPSQQVVLSALR